MEACSCKVGLGVLGTPQCTETEGLVKKLIYVNYFDESGQVYSIPESTTIDDNYITARINESNASIKWYVSPDVEDVDQPREDPEYQTFDSGRKARTAKPQIKSFSAMHPSAHRGLMKGYANYKCAKLGVFVVFDDERILFDGSVDGQIRPLRIADTTFNVYYKDPKGSELQGIMLSFDWDTLVKDENLKTIAVDGDILNANDLIEGSISETSHDGDQIVFTVPNNYDGDITGILPGDITAFNVTDAGNASGTLAENNGVYTYTYGSTQDGGDVIQLTISKTGLKVPVYEYTV